MHLSKVIKGLGITALAALALAGCGKKNDSGGSATAKNDAKVATSGFPIVKDKLSMTLMAPSMGEAEWKDMQVLQDYAKKTGISLKYNTPPNSDFGTKLNLAFASQDLPDIIYAAGTANLTPANEVTYGEQGQLIALEKLIPKYAPNLNKLMKEDPSIAKSITTPDGHIYSLPMLSRGSTSAWYIGPMWYNGEWLKNLGVTELPKTADEFYDLLKRFKNEDPNKNGKADEIPLSDVKLDASRWWLMSIFGLLTNDVQNNGDKVFYTPISNQYKEYLTYMHKLYEEGLLDKDTFSQSDDQKKAKGKADRLGVFQDYYSLFTTGRSQSEAMSDPMWQPLTSSVSKKAVVPGNPRISRGNFAITKNNPSPAAALRWVDYFYSPIGAAYLASGPEGLLWKYETNKEGEKVRVYADGVNSENAEEKRSKITPDYGLTVPKLSGSDAKGEAEYKYAIRSSADASPIDDFTKFINSETAKKIDPYATVPFPLIYLTKAEQDSVSATANDLKTFVTQSEAKFITGVTPLSDWDKYVKTIEGMNVKQYVKVYQTAYDRWKSAK
ncbi:extracellular solute-binding protein [Lapidilactobacillus salsurivasis]